METINIQGQDFKAVNIKTSKSRILAIFALKGFLACRYINTESANKLEEALAIVTKVQSYEEMLEAKIIDVSQEAKLLGVKIDDTGIEALKKMSR